MTLSTSIRAMNLEQVQQGLRWEDLRRNYFEALGQWEQAKEATRCYENLVRRLQEL